MRGHIVFVAFLLLVPLALGVTGPINHNGKEYYVVTSTDASEDTGNEVCAKVGKTCVGYTEESTAVCKKAHPGALTSSSFSGDKTGVYCDGPPQTNICAGKRNTCHECPACTASVSCGTPIGGLYREMYVECRGTPTSAKAAPAPRAAPTPKAAAPSPSTGPFTYGGKQYYIVTSTDPSMDSGDEVCAKVGKACLGYNEPSTAVCKLAHPSGRTTSSTSGDQSGVYCNGPPQGGLCGSSTDTCHACPSCTTGVQCYEAIGGLYREMYVECGTSSCPVTLHSRNTQSLLNEIPTLNAQLKGCPTSLPSSISRIISGNVVVNIAMKAGGTQSITATVSGNKITGVSRGAGTCKHKISVSETDLDDILNSRDRTVAFMRAYGSGKVKLGGCTVIRKFISFVSAPVTRFIARRSTPPPPPPPPPAARNCGKIGEQCNNRGCDSGICGAPWERLPGGGQWGYWNYRCLSQSDFNSFCVGRGNTRPAYSCLTGPCRT